MVAIIAMYHLKLDQTAVICLHSYMIKQFYFKLFNLAYVIFLVYFLCV